MMMARSLVLLVVVAISVSACHTTEEAPPLTCGTLRCDPQTSYCETIMTDVPELPSDYACRPLPNRCRASADSAPRDCGCFPRGTRGDLCTASAVGGVASFYRTTVGGR